MLQYLFSPTKQFTYESGKLLDAGKIYVYIKDTTDLATLYDNDEDMISNPVILDANGRASVKADDTKEYRLEIYTNKDVLLYTCNAFYDGEGGGGISIVRHDDTLSGNGTSQSLLSVVNIPLAVDETMTAYKDTVEGKEALVLGVNGEWFNETFSGALSGKVDTSAFEECCSAMSAAVSGKVDLSDLDNYYTKIETQNILNNYVQSGDLNYYYKKTETSSREELQSAFDAVVTGGDSPNISAQSIYPEGVEQLNLGSTFDSLYDISANGSQNHNLDLGGVKYRLPDAYNIGSALYETNIFLPTSSFTEFSADNSAKIDDLSGQIQYVSGAVDYVSANIPDVPDVSANEWNSVYETVSAHSGQWEEPAGKIYSGIYPIGVNNDTDQISADTQPITFGSGLQFTNGVLSVTGQFDNTAVNQVVQQYSANGKWLTQTALNGYATTATLKLSAQVLSGRDNYLSAAIDYVSANIGGGGGHTYTGIAPVYVDNTNDEIGVDQLAFSAGYGIDLQVSGGNTLVISSTLAEGHTYNGVSPIVVDNVNNIISAEPLFPMTGNGFSANVRPSAISLLSQFSNVYLTNSSVSYAQAPSTNISATWYDICKAANESEPPVVSAFRFGNFQTTAIINLNNIKNLQQITFIAPRGYDDGTYSALFCDGDTMDSYRYKLEIFSGCCQDIVHEQDSTLGDRWCRKVWNNQGFYETQVLL